MEKKNQKSKRTGLIIGGALLIAVIAAIVIICLIGVRDEKLSSGQVIFTPAEAFLKGKQDITFEVAGVEGEYEIYYSLDGSQVTADSPHIAKDGSISVLAMPGASVSCRTIHAKAKLSDGSWTAESVKSYFISPDIENRFDCKVVALSTDNANLYGDTGIIDHYDETGVEWEKPVHVEIFDSDGKTLISQEGGIRINGGWTRELKQKSFRLYARKEYGEENKWFDYPLFEGAVDADGKEITRYKRLVLRNSGNDMYKTFLRDALVQNLSAEAGFQDTERCEPCAVFLNNEYIGFYWLQDYVGDKLFETNYGKDEGEFDKSTHHEEGIYDDPAGTRQNLEFLDLAKLDLTDDANYKKVTDTIDVSNYLFYVAINVIADNEDWPQTNTVSYRYIPGVDEGYSENPRDGKWRWVIHDADFCYGGGTSKNHPSNECLKLILNRKAYAVVAKKELYPYYPLFAALMERDDCRKEFISKVEELVNGAFSVDNVMATYERIKKACDNELSYFFKESAKAVITRDKYNLYCQELETVIRNSVNSIADQIKDIWGVEIKH